jgi:acetyl esterase/lipase
MPKLKLCWIITILVLQSPCIVIAQHIDKEFEKKEIISSKHWLDIDYVGDGQIGHKLDIHLPEKKKKKYPVVICIYGSAFFSNHSKSATFSEGIGQALLNAGYAVVTINHRASSDDIFPAQIQDVKAAIRFIRANAVSFSLDTSFIGITGWSSGGHLAAFAGSSNGVKYFELEGDTIDIEGSLGAHNELSSHVDAVVDWYGPTNFLIMDECGSSIKHDDENSPESLLIGGAIQSNKNTCRLADPATYINSYSAPFLIIHGDKDPLVPYCQSEYLFSRLKEDKINAEFITVDGGKHGPGVLIPKYFQKMIFFFDEQRKEKQEN